MLYNKGYIDFEYKNQIDLLEESMISILALLLVKVKLSWAELEYYFSVDHWQTSSFSTAGFC